MAFVNMKCPNCGAPMRLINNQLTCSHCNTMILNIVDSKIDADVTIISPEEFAKQLNVSKKQFIVNINDEFQVFDADTKIINKKIKDATNSLNQRLFDKVFKILEGVSDSILSAERLRFLANFKVQSESELVFHEGYIDKCEFYSNIINLADPVTKDTYIALANHCKTQYDRKETAKQEIAKTNELFKVGLKSDALLYAQEMCRKYPTYAISWLNLIDINKKLNKNYKGDREVFIMSQCLDFNESLLPDWLKKRYGIGYPLGEIIADKLKSIGKILLWCFIGCFTVVGIIALAIMPFLLFAVPIGLATFAIIFISGNIITYAVRKHRWKQVKNGIFPSENAIRFFVCVSTLELLLGIFALIMFVNPQLIFARIHWIVSLVIFGCLVITIGILIVLLIKKIASLLTSNKLKIVGNYAGAILNIAVLLGFIVLFVAAFIGAPNKTYKLSTTYDLNLLNNLPSANTANYKLVNDIDFEGKEFNNWSNIRFFYGTFDGNGYAIKNFVYYDDSKATGQDAFKDLIRSDGLVGVNYGTIKNLSFINCRIAIDYNDARNISDAYLGMFAGQNGGVIKSCSVYDCVIQYKIFGKIREGSTYENGYLIGINGAYRESNVDSLSEFSYQGTLTDCFVYNNQNFTSDDGYTLVIDER